MITIRHASERGQSRYSWLESYHTFSFAGYHDPRHMGFHDLRVINEDRVQPGGGFGTHSHRDMEIISYVIEGALEHKDSMGNGSIIRPGELQMMRAGTGVTHSEYNHSKTDLVHFLQIWVIPDKEGLEPAYDQREFSADERRGRLRLVASPDGSEGSVRVHQDLSLFATLLEDGESLQHVLPRARHAWVQVVKGDLAVNGVQLSAGDGLGITEESSLELVASTGSEVLLFDLS
jgi:redox-sensitive bicupin YhaK (pirin superfamily)